MTIVAERIFTTADQRSFAALSGDFNPMHMDEVAARRTFFGAPVVHGVHLLCWALDSWAGSSSHAHTALERVKANFNRGVLVGEVVRTCVLSHGEEFNLQIRRNESPMVSIWGKLGSTVEYLETFPAVDPTECRVMDPAQVSHAAGSLPLAYSAADASQLFPHLSATLPAIQLAALLATTRLVGMECPGLFSLYAGLDLSFSEHAIGKPQLNYRVPRAIRFGAMSLAVNGPGFQGELRAFLRPRPCRQAAASELAQLVAKDAFSDQWAIVIGGSRGLGEVTAKLLAMGGADVTITYHRGKVDAEAVAAEIKGAGGKCDIVQFDSNRPALFASRRPLTHLYYFATPHIASDSTVPFSVDRFAEYCNYYATGFAQTLLAIAQGARRVNVFYPSTTFLDDSQAHMPEYCAAKAVGEEVCKQLAKHFPGWCIYAPRLPRMRTDQNNGLVRVEMESPEIVLLRHLQEMKSRSSAPTASSCI
jgi:MaoC like domain/short chain dehydrogenase